MSVDTATVGWPAHAAELDPDKRTFVEAMYAYLDAFTERRIFRVAQRLAEVRHARKLA